MTTHKKTNVTKGTYTAADLAEYLSISRAGAYNLMHSQGFPAFRAGRRILVMCKALDQWLQEQQRKVT